MWRVTRRSLDRCVCISPLLLVWIGRYRTGRVWGMSAALPSLGRRRARHERHGCDDDEPREQQGQVLDSAATGMDTGMAAAVAAAVSLPAEADRAAMHSSVAASDSSYSVPAVAVVAAAAVAASDSSVLFVSD